MLDKRKNYLIIPDFRRFSQNIVLRSLGEYSSEKDFRFLF